MGDTTELKKMNGESIIAEVISFFQVVKTNKKYVFYTLNETVENGLVKMYVSEVFDSSNMVLSGDMTDYDWASLKAIMKSILTGNANGEIKYLKMEGE